MRKVRVITEKISTVTSSPNFLISVEATEDNPSWAVALGGAVGGVVGTVGGPLGMVAGAAAGAVIGGKIGNLLGGGVQYRITARDIFALLPGYRGRKGGVECKVQQHMVRYRETYDCAQLVPN